MNFSWYSDWRNGRDGYLKLVVTLVKSQTSYNYKLVSKLLTQKSISLTLSLNLK